VQLALTHFFIWQPVLKTIGKLSTIRGFGHRFACLFVCLFVFQLRINKQYPSKIPYIFYFAISIVLLEISADILPIYHPTSQKDDIPFPRGVKSALYSACTPTAIGIGQ